MKGSIAIYVDGAASNNQFPALRRGGWAAIIMLLDNQGQLDPREGAYKEISGTVNGASNQQMELEAVRQALLALKQKGLQVCIHTDSNYVLGLMGALGKAWKPKENLNLIAEVKALVGQHMVSFAKVKAHSGHLYNERADTLAVAASLAEQ